MNEVIRLSFWVFVAAGVFFVAGVILFSINAASFFIVSCCNASVFLLIFSFALFVGGIIKGE